MSLQLAVILPTLNERGNLRPLVERLARALDGLSWEAIFVDDNSRDGTSDEARAISLEDPRVRVIQRIGRRGLASAAIEGMCATAAPVVAVMDADHQHDPALLPGMLTAVNSGEYDLAYASRFAEGASMEAWNRPDREKVSGLANAPGPQGDRHRSDRSNERILHAEGGNAAAGRAAAVRALASRSCSIFWRRRKRICGSRNSLSISPPVPRARASWIGRLCLNS